MLRVAVRSGLLLSDAKDNDLQRMFDAETAHSKSLQQRLKAQSGDATHASASETFDAEAARVLQGLTGLSFVRRHEDTGEQIDWKMDFLLSDPRKANNDQPRLCSSPATVLI